MASLLLVLRPAPQVAFLLLVAMPGAPNGVLAGEEPQVAFLLLEAMQGAPSSVLASSSKAKSPK